MGHFLLHESGLVLLVFTIGHWQPEIGDPSAIGWFTVLSYYLCAAVSLAYVFKAWPRMDPTDRCLRIVITLFVIVLGLSKQFNLPGAVTEIGRIIANWAGGYELRRWLQVSLLLLGGLGFVVVGRWLSSHNAAREAGKRCAPEMICLGYLAGLIMLRAVSLHQIGALLAMEVFGVRINWIVELAGIYALIVVVFVRFLTGTSHRT